MKQSILLSLFVFIFFKVGAQNQSVSGVVLHGDTKLPVSEAHVFIPNTSFQTFTDSLGQYSLNNIPLGEWKLVFAKRGFKLIQKEAILKGGIPISISSTIYEIENDQQKELKPSKIKKARADFESLIKGGTKNENLVIVNPEVVSYFTDMETGEIWAKTKDQLIVQNLDLGYVVSVWLNSPINISQPITEGELLLAFFEMDFGTLEEKDFFNTNRVEAYQNSLTYELRRLIGEKGDSLELLPTNQEGEFLIKVVSPFQFSVNPNKSVEFKGEGIRIRSNGTVVKTNLLRMEGFPFSDSPLGQLPIDFNFDRALALNEIEKSPEALQEKIFLHTDKDIYLIGEELYFKAYLQLGNPMLIDEASQVLHIEIVDPSGYSMIHKVFPLVNGVADGKIFLSPELNTKDFIVKAYTLWGANYGIESEFYKPIQVLGSLWETNNTIQETRSERVKLFADKEAYQSKDSVTLNVMVNNSKGAIAAANLSLSVVKKNGVYFKNLSNENYVTYFSNDLNSTSVDTSSFSFEKEFGLTIKGQIVDKKDQISKSKLEVLVDGLLDKRELSPDQNGQFLLKGIHKEGEFSVLVKGIDAKGLPIEGVELGLMSSINHPDPLTLEFPSVQTLDTRPKGVDSLMSAYLELREGEILLDAVEVEDVKESGFGTMPYGKPQQVLEMDGVFLSGDTQQFIYSFSNRVGFKVAGVPPMILNQRGAQPGPPLILLNGSPITSITGPTIGSDPGDEQFRALQSINVFNIERVEVIKSVAVAYGDAGKYGVINIITKTSKDRENDVNTFEEFKLMGLEQSAVEAINNFDSESHTIFWDPNVRISSNQTSTSIKFKLPDDPGPFWVLVNGLNSSGEPVSGRFLLNQNQLSDN
ncbi:carboxypeptidase-like regulatory domain-containing protein [Algoriphagus machipongonensis]|uniref:TonB-dependent receptor plug domain-containing protein n=1 Tax=Algoriphagus machipongonensis TaxID=388413 RepID=A3I208_9BACT|nr:carboxypeptidase-like regulatory domain-containing protein [Algoriphagus machipongonensis]EAZ79412.1 hypothetical protein ALPR1_04198 [Algoriphagus machipongonensis]